MIDYMFRAIPAFAEYPIIPDATNPILNIWYGATPVMLPDIRKCIALDFSKTLSKVIMTSNLPWVDDPESDGYTELYPGILRRGDGTAERGAVYINETYIPATPSPDWPILASNVPMYQCLIRYQGGIITRFHGFLAAIKSVDGMEPKFKVDFYWANQIECDKMLPLVLPTAKHPNIPINLEDKDLWEPSISTLNTTSSPGDVGFLFLSATKYKATHTSGQKLDLPKLPPSLGLSGRKWP